MLDSNAEQGSSLSDIDYYALEINIDRLKINKMEIDTLEMEVTRYIN